MLADSISRIIHDETRLTMKSCDLELLTHDTQVPLYLKGRLDKKINSCSISQSVYLLQAAIKDNREGKGGTTTSPRFMYIVTQPQFGNRPELTTKDDRQMAWHGRQQLPRCTPELWPNELTNQPVAVLSPRRSLAMPTHMQKASDDHSTIIFQSIALETFPPSLFDSATANSNCGAVDMEAASCLFVVAMNDVHKAGRRGTLNNFSTGASHKHSHILDDR
jgi:hypothetical protein